MLTTIPDIDRTLEERSGDMLNRWLGYCPLPPEEHLWTSANEAGEVWLRGLVSAGYPICELVRYLGNIPGVRCVINDVAVIYRGRAIRI